MHLLSVCQARRCRPSRASDAPAKVCEGAIREAIREPRDPGPETAPPASAHARPVDPGVWPAMSRRPRGARDREGAGPRRCPAVGILGLASHGACPLPRWRRRRPHGAGPRGAVANGLPGCADGREREAEVPRAAACVRAAAPAGYITRCGLRAAPLPGSLRLQDALSPTKPSAAAGFPHEVRWRGSAARARTCGGAPKGAE